MSALRFLLQTAIVVLLMGGRTVLGQDHHGHDGSPPGEAERDAQTDTSLWDQVDADLRTEFDSAYTLVMRDPEGLARLYGTYLDRIPARAILQFLEQKHAYCHIAAHDLGMAVYRHYGNLGVAVEECGDGCSSACMHGAVREAFGGDTVDEIVASVDSVCAIDGMAEINHPGNCAHALGHALMMATGDSLRASLQACARFPGLSLPHYCATGVFMEYGANHSHRDPEWMASGTASRYPCDEFPEFAAACYRYVMPRMRRILKTDDASVLKAECRKLERHEQLGCFRGIGVAFGGTVRKSPEMIREVCADSSNDNVLVCIDALMEQVTYLKPVGTEATICAELDGEAHDVCEAALSGRYQLYKPVMDLYLGVGE